MTRPSRRTIAVLAVLLVAALVPAAAAIGSDHELPTTKQECKRGGWQNFPEAGFRNQGQCIRFVLTGDTVCRDPLGCVSYGEGDPIRLAAALVLSGPISFLGIDALQSIEIALDARGLVAGREVDLVSFDSMCSPEGGEEAGADILDERGIVAVVGTSCSSAAFEAAPILSPAGYSMVSPSNTAPFLTDPATHSAGYLRSAWNDRDQGMAMAEFASAAEEDGGLAADSAAIVVINGDAFSTAVGAAFIEAFGGTSVVLEAADDGSDVAAIVAAIALDPPDILYLPLFEPLASAFVIAARAERALNSTHIAGTDVFADPFFIDSLGDGAEGLLLTLLDQSYTGDSNYLSFAAEYASRHGTPPLLFAPFAYDATNMILDAIEEVAAVQSGTVRIGRQELRDALFDTAELAGLTGTITCEPNGECGAAEFQILTVDDMGDLIPPP